ncbi:MAG TPA: glycoside hydrolase domain-containing protein [Actinoplanes sp.]|nr:glycoside hydrolase domain-containing protein [Actinoplanes sp.]
MDANVLAAQKWVNATYRGVVGYNVIAEDGIAGWQTMYALTRALQHELGITALADNFGNATLAALSAHGSIGPGETNANIVKIVECGAYCKGYDPQGITGVYGPAVAAAVAALMTQAGLAAKVDGKLAPKVFKALLNMDGYQLTAGGSAAVRSAQQWLNDRYLNRSAFFVLPCDGHGSRDVLRALIFAVQYEIGLTDSQANGNFGPATQAGLKAQGTVKKGSSGPWVRLFTAALALYPSAQRFLDAFDDQLTTDVRSFQAFCCLPQTGDGDFSTWASLLISTGDQARTATAADTITEVTTARAATLTSGGYRVIGRYLTNVEGTDLDKKIKPGELATIFANGIKLFVIFQTYADSASFFTRAQGYADALAAHDAAVGHGLDTGTVIYFAVDYDAFDTEIDGRVVPYFLGVEAGLRDRGRRYAHGVYGARNVCTRVSREAYAQWSFVSGITSGWSGNMAYPLPDNWSFDQIATLDIGSGSGLIQIDKCVQRPYTDVAVAAVNSAATSFSAYVDWVESLHSLAVDFGGGDADGLVLGYLRAGRYDNWQADQLFGTIDHAFVSHVDAGGVARLRTYRDPGAGVDVDISQFGAACLAALRQSGDRADFGGWGADWIAFYSGWRQAGAPAPAHDYSTARIGKSDSVSAFGAAALVADVDAFHAAAALRGGTGLVEHLRTAEQTARYSRFLIGRFGGDSGAAAAAALTMLTATGDAQLAAARSRMLTGAVVVDDEVRGLCQGFADGLTALAQAEQ